MKSAQQMINFCFANGINYFSDPNKLLSHFKLIEQSMNSREKVLAAFDCNGVKNRGGGLIRGGAMAVAFTNEKVIYAQAGVLVPFVKEIGYETITGISAKKGFAFADIIVDSINEYAQFVVDKNAADKIRNLAIDAIENYRNRKSASNSKSRGISSADEIKKYKALLDDGVITQKEFEAKKKQLLGL